MSGKIVRDDGGACEEERWRDEKETMETEGRAMSGTIVRDDGGACEEERWRGEKETMEKETMEGRVMSGTIAGRMRDGGTMTRRRGEAETMEGRLRNDDRNEWRDKDNGGTRVWMRTMTIEGGRGTMDKEIRHRRPPTPSPPTPSPHKNKPQHL